MTSTGDSVRAKTRLIRETEAEDVVFEMDVVDLVVGGATVRQIADRYLSTMDEVRGAYKRGLARLTDRSLDRSMELREEITARQRSLILANLPKARAGDTAAAAIVGRADNLLASLWGLRSLRIEPGPRDRDSGLTEALEAYLAGLSAANT